MPTIESLFELAIELRDSGNFDHSIGVLSKVLDRYPGNDSIYKVYVIRGGIYNSQGQHKMALEDFKRATHLNPKSEFASLGLYISYTELSQHEDAIRELIRYLVSYPAEFYRDTLAELLHSLDESYMAMYAEDIRRIARKNGIEM
jgi:tetratricopeptide (TPR) repeat protein